MLYLLITFPVPASIHPVQSIHSSPRYIEPSKFEPIIIISQRGEGGEGETGLAYARSLFRRKINSTPSFDASQEWKSIIITAAPPPPSSLSWPRFAITLGCCSFAHARCHLITISLFAFRLRWRWVRTRARRACVPPAHGIEGEGGRRCGRVTIERSFDVMAPPPFLPRKLRLYCA